MQIDKQYGNVYWNEPGGHQWGDADRQLCASAELTLMYMERTAPWQARRYCQMLGKE